MPTKQQEWMVYIIACHDGCLYTGITNNLSRRLNEHQTQSQKCAKFLRGKKNLQLVFSQPVKSKSDALKIEYQIKQLPKQQKLQLIAKGVYAKEITS